MFDPNNRDAVSYTLITLSYLANQNKHRLLTKLLNHINYDNVYGSYFKLRIARIVLFDSIENSHVSKPKAGFIDLGRKLLEEYYLLEEKSFQEDREYYDEEDKLIDFIDSTWKYLKGILHIYDNDKTEGYKLICHAIKSGEEEALDVLYRFYRFKDFNSADKMLLEALFYYNIGFNISHIQLQENEYNYHSCLKAPSHKWHNLLNERQSFYDILEFNWSQAIGFGTFTGEYNKYLPLCVLDIDNCQSEDFLHEVLEKLDLPLDYEWVIKSGSNNGFHIYISSARYFDNDSPVTVLIPNEKYEGYFDKIELLWSTHVILPPSIHSSSNQYNFNYVDRPKNSPISISTRKIGSLITTFTNYDYVIEKDDYGETYKRIIDKSHFYEIVKKRFKNKELQKVNMFVDVDTVYSHDISKHHPDHQILLISWLLTDQDGIVLKKHTYVLSSEELYNLESIDHALMDCKNAKLIAKNSTEILQSFVADLDLCDQIISHNLEFVFNIIKKEIIKKKIKINRNNMQGYCTMKGSVNLCKIPRGNGYKYPKLTELYYHLFGVEVNSFSNAEIDVFRISKCYHKMQKLNVADN